mmetsp:Transcript_60912/g.161759  ORF Transcript_60912/g.161759 Transcript_60912/m.161759 type:complete len:201 (+) Transcript_60912:2193-2795(+)
MVVRLVVDHLWSEVIEGSAERAPFVSLRHFRAPSKIGEFGNEPLAHEHVFWLQVPMDNATPMQVVKRAADVHEDCCACSLRKGSSAPQHAVQRPQRCEFEQEMQRFPVLEIVIQTDNVRVLQPDLSLDLASKIFLQLVFLHISLGDVLHCEDLACLFPSHLSDCASSANANPVFNGLEIVNRISHGLASDDNLRRSWSRA